MWVVEGGLNDRQLCLHRDGFRLITLQFAAKRTAFRFC